MRNRSPICLVAVALAIGGSGCDAISRVLWEDKAHVVDYRVLAQPAKPNAALKVVLDAARSDTRLRVFALDLEKPGLLLVTGGPENVSSSESWVEAIVLPAEGDTPLARGYLPVEAVAGPGPVYVVFSLVNHIDARMDVLLSFHEGVVDDVQ